MKILRYIKMLVNNFNLSIQNLRAREMVHTRKTNSVVNIDQTGIEVKGVKIMKGCNKVLYVKNVPDVLEDI